jgi:hypothetical protein
MQLKVDNKFVKEWYVDEPKHGDYEVVVSDYKDYQVKLPLSAGKHNIEVIFPNDYYDAQSKDDRNLYVESIEITYPSGEGRWKHLIKSTNEIVKYDRGNNFDYESYSDNKDVIAGQEAMNWAGALKFPVEIEYVDMITLKEDIKPLEALSEINKKEIMNSSKKNTKLVMATKEGYLYLVENGKKQLIERLLALPGLTDISSPSPSLYKTPEVIDDENALLKKAYKFIPNNTYYEINLTPYDEIIPYYKPTRYRVFIRAKVDNLPQNKDEEIFRIETLNYVHHLQPVIPGVEIKEEDYKVFYARDFEAASKYQILSFDTGPLF